ncbi:MAG: hypothetical protein U0638_13360 [Phycisphaerales bacterium]
MPNDAEIAQTNPAQELLVLLQDMLARQRGISTRQAMAECIGVDPNDNVQFAVALGEFYALIGRAKASVRNAGLKESIHLRSFPGIEQAFALDSVRNSWDQQARFLTEAVMGILEATADALLEKAPERSIPKAALDDVLRETRELIELVGAADVPMVIRQLYTDFLLELERAVSQYRVRGGPGLRKAVEQGLGTIVLAWTRRPEDRKSVLSQKLLALWQGVTVLVSFANEAIQLTDGVRQLLDIDKTQ